MNYGFIGTLGAVIYILGITSIVFFTREGYSKLIFLGVIIAGIGMATCFRAMDNWCFEEGDNFKYTASPNK